MLWLLLLPITFSDARMDCSKTEYEKCVRLADPLVKEAHLVFPDNVNDIDQVCNIWNQFVDCLKIYTDQCFTDLQRRQFNKAVESPIESVHQMCTKPSYQKEYLQYATCIKSTIVQTIHCGNHYKLLVDQVEQGEVISKATLCCSHDIFRQCVQRETRRLCDRGISGGPATRFATQIIDKALRFLQDQCLNYIPNSGDCQLHPTDSLPFSERSDPSSISTSPSELSSWSSTPNQEAPRAKELSNVRVPGDYPTQMLGSRTRPASYGRSNGWSSEGNAPVVGNTVQMYPETAPTPSTRSEWGSSMWGAGRTTGTTPPLPSPTTQKAADKLFSSRWSSVEATSEVWYPAVGSQAGNEVEEPNQLGLKKPRNSSWRIQGNVHVAIVVGFYVTFCMIR